MNALMSTKLAYLGSSAIGPARILSKSIWTPFIVEWMALGLSHQSAGAPSVASNGPRELSLLSRDERDIQLSLRLNGRTCTTLHHFPSRD
jgi:hypothetical protein